MVLTDYTALREYATARQAECIDALAKYGSQSKAAKALGVHPRNLQRALENVRKSAVRKGFSPPHDMTHPAPDGYFVRGVSTLYTPDGVAAQWVKTNVDQERMLEFAREIVAAMSEDIKREKPVTRRKPTNAELLNLYTITDHHLGMYSWAEETGADWDATIAEDLLVSWFAEAISLSPPAEVGVLGQLGDFLHWDGMEAVTPEHRNILDADTRFERLVRIAIRVLRRVVRMLLEKHERVHIIMAEGNHDPASSVWLREWFAALYEDEPRVTVDQSPDPYYAYEWGSTLLGLHHGHKRKVKNIDHVFAAKFREEFGRTKHCYIHTGHYHESALVESGLAVVEQHRTLAAPDAYASRGGWLSGRSASVITYHKDYGEVGRVVISPEMCSPTP